MGQICKIIIVQTCQIIMGKKMTSNRRFCFHFFNFLDTRIMIRKQIIEATSVAKVKLKTDLGPNSLNKCEAKNGKTQLAALLPMKTNDTCFKSGIFLVSQVIPEGNKKQVEKPIRPVHMNNIEAFKPKMTNNPDEIKQPVKLEHRITSGLTTVDKGIPMSLPNK